MKALLSFIRSTLLKLIHQPLKIWLLMGGILIGTLVFTAIFTYVTFVKDISTPEYLMNRNNTGLVLTDRNDDVFYKSEGVKDFTPIPLSDIPKSLKDATIAIEDKDFYRHGGLSLAGIARSVYLNFRFVSSNRFGGSTITQQLVKNALLSPEKSFRRKFQEAILALEIERRYSKDEILEMYLNSIYYGAGAYGIQEAAQTYFDKDPKSLNLAESVLLASLPQAPSRLTPFGGDADPLKERMILVVDRMEEDGYITNDQKETVLNQKFTFADPPEPDTGGTAPHFAIWVRDYLYQKYGEDSVNRLGFRVKTTLDLKLQEKAQDILKRRIAALGKQQVGNGGVIVFNHTTGEILTMVGSKDWTDEEVGKFNVVFAHRQPGSSFKPIVYTRAFMDGMKPIDILHDKATDFAGYKPKNYDGKFRGDVTIRRALANSLNVPAVELLNKVGVSKSITLAKDMGITTLTDADRYGLSLVLGGGEVELFELTRAYGVLGNKGEFVPTHPILTIEDKFDKTLYSYNTEKKSEENHFEDSGILGFLNNAAEPFKEKRIGGIGNKRAVDETYAYITTHILSDDFSRREIFGSGSALLLSRPAAAKTGTTDSYRDSWTIGYTPEIVTGVWIGNNDNTPMQRVAGSIGAAPIWQDVMEAAHAGKSIKQFEKPRKIVEMEICADTRMKACASCTQKYKEIFVIGSQPLDECPEDITPSPEPTTEETPTPEPTEEPEQPTEAPTQTPAPTESLSPTPIELLPTSTPNSLPTVFPT